MSGPRIATFILICGLSTIPALGSWRQTGPFGGNAEIVTLVPGDSQRLLAATEGGLLYRSEDSGKTWQYLPFSRAFSSTVHALAIDPKHDTTFYLGISDEEPSMSGLYKTDDGGRTWRLLPGTKGEQVFALSIWNRNPQVVAIGSASGVHLSRDGGENWLRISPSDNPELMPVVSLTFDPVHSEILYAGTPHLPWRTLDGGDTWTSIHLGLIDDSDIFSLQVDPKSPLHILAGACSGIYSSRDGGNHWLKLLGIPGESRRTYTVRQDPSDSTIIYAGTSHGLWKTSDAGLNWRLLSTAPAKSVAIDPKDPNNIYVAGEAGLMRSSDGAETLSAINTGFVNRRLSDVLLTGGQLFASTAYENSSGGLFHSENDGRWERLEDPSDLLQENVAFLAGDKNTLFAASHQAIACSNDEGKTWRLVNWEGGSIRALRMVTGEQAQTVLAGSENGLFLSNDNGVSWERVEDRAVDGIFTSSDGNSILITTRDGLQLSNDRGKSWTATVLPERNNPVYDIALQNAALNAVIIAATSRGLFRSVDRGNSWTLVTSGVMPDTVSAVTFSSDGQELYIAQYEKLYRSLDAGLTWQSFDIRGLESSPVHALRTENGFTGILAVTVSRGVFMYLP